VAKWSAEDVDDRTGQVVVITGANSGVGLEAARVLAQRGATVVLACRDPQRAETARAELADGASGAVSTLALDLTDLDSVSSAAKTLGAEHDHVDGLVLNAGVMGGTRMSSAQGFERQMATNHLGHFAFAAQTWPLVASAPAGRVVTISSLASRGGKLGASTTREDLVDPTPYRPNRVYSNTKQANLLFSQELHRRLTAAGSPVRSIAAHPGVSATELFSRQLREQRLGFVVPIAQRVIMPVFFQSQAAGALPTLRALCDPAVESGAFVGPTTLRGSRGNPEIIPVFKPGTDVDAAEHLWDLSEDITGVTFTPYGA
jgi:NAD(P)-dependent dehydrogenase (short-subunit alcohol dehydrogenase family)